jgi:hypothetical protein
MAKIYNFYNDDRTVDSEYISDGMLNHETFFLTELRSVDPVDIQAGVNLQVKEYTETELKALAVAKDLTLSVFNDGTFIEYLNSDNNIWQFSFPEETGEATIDSAAKTVAIEVANGTVVTALVATFRVSDGAAADISDTPQVSGTTANDFTAPVVYTVTGDDGVEEDWTVTVTVAAP